MVIRPLPLRGAALVETTPFRDERGAFARFFCSDELAPLLGDRKVVNVNHSVTARVGAVRGIHFQHPPSAEMKFVRCLRGRVWDVAVDLRRSSPTFLKYHAEELTPENARMLVIPEGFAHGFQVLEPDSEMLYLHTAFYDAGREGRVRCDDPAISIAWPLPVTDLSEKDRSCPLLGPDYEGITL